MNSIKLPPIVQESMFSSGCSEDLLSDKSDDISILPGTLLINSSMTDFTQTDMPESFTVEKECGTSTRPSRMRKKMQVIKGKVNTHDHGCLYCPLCNSVLSHNGNLSVSLKHIPFGVNIQNCSSQENVMFVPTRNAGTSGTKVFPSKLQITFLPFLQKIM